METKFIFDQTADFYDEARPNYSPEILKIIEKRKNNIDNTLDIACGTGKLTRLVAPLSKKVTGIDLGEALIKKAQLLAKDIPTIEFKHCSFEGYGEEQSFDLITCSQAFHWLEPIIRVEKIKSLLRADGILAIVQNIWPPDNSDFRKKLDEIYLEVVPEIAQANSKNKSRVNLSLKESLSEELSNVGGFDKLESFIFDYPQAYNKERYIKLLATYSDHIKLNENKFDLLTNKISATFDLFNDHVEINYKTQLLITNLL